MQAIATKQITKESIMGAFATKMDSAVFKTWIAPLQIDVCEKCLYLVAQNQFTADYVKKEYGNILANIAADFSLDINICVNGAMVAVKSANDNIVCEYTPSTSVQKNIQNDFNDFINCDENMFTVEE